MPGKSKYLERPWESEGSVVPALVLPPGDENALEGEQGKTVECIHPKSLLLKVFSIVVLAYIALV